jgi:SAM-dependent methyltransferase
VEKNETDDRIEREKQFHDDIYASQGREGLSFFYPAATTVRSDYESQILEGCAGKRVLEYGCGLGSYSYELTTRGARVTGIDISRVAIEHAQSTAADRGLRIDFRVMNAESLDFPDGAFDLVCGSGILHHLNMATALDQIRRVLAPGGKGVFVEPLGHNPLVNGFRRMTPWLRSRDEHPFTDADLEMIRGIFPGARITPYYLLAIAAFGVRPRSLYPAVSRGLERLDAAAFSFFPRLKKYAWQVVMVLERS